MTVKLVADPYPPYQFEEGGEIIGVDHDIVAESLKIHGITAETSLHNWDDCMALMEKGTADGIFQITRTPERTAQFLFSECLRTARTVFFKKAGYTIHLNDSVDLITQLRGLRIGVQSGYSYSPSIDSLGAEYKIERESGEDLLMGLLQDECSLILMDHGVAVYLMKRLGIREIERVQGFDIQRALHVAFQKDHADLIRHFNEGLGTLKKNGTYGEIFRTYGLDIP
jgi:polar amino acid transport system substrate-binding protein